jgi:hypothetical protein
MRQTYIQESYTLYKLLKLFWHCDYYFQIFAKTLQHNINVRQ